MHDVYVTEIKLLIYADTPMQLSSALNICWCEFTSVVAYHKQINITYCSCYIEQAQ